MMWTEGVASDACEAAGEVGRALAGVLGEGLVAVYLHGSAVLGGFRWDRSDLDILALSRASLSDQQLGETVRALGTVSYPANGLEFSLMTAAEALRRTLPSPRFQLHQTTDGWDRAGKTVDGRTRKGDPDLILHLAVCRQRGIAIVGPPASAALGDVPDQEILSAMRDEIRWARKHAPLEYLVLTSARAWLFFETRRISSKVEAGEWAAKRYGEPALIEAALARQRGARSEMRRDVAERLADHVARFIAGAQGTTT